MYRTYDNAVKPDLNSWREAAGRFEEIPETAHQRLLSRLREYLFVGGMPEAVLEFQESGSLSEVLLTPDS